MHNRVLARPRITGAAILAILTSAVLALAASAPAQAFARPSDDSVIQRIFAETNQIRAENGKGPLKLNASISAVASSWSQQQAAANAMSHNPNFSVQIPKGWTRAGENVAYGQDPTASDPGDGLLAVMHAWKNSPGHLANIIGDYTDIGIGIAYASNGYPYYTQNFGKYGASVGPANALPAGTPEPSTDPSVPTPIYRFWSQTSQAHFFTASGVERDTIIRNYPSNVWHYEGVAYYAYSTQQPGTVPLYRFWSQTQQGHFYTTDANERDTIIRTYPTSVWNFEGTAYYVYPSDSTVAGSTTVYRFWSPTYRHHFYTSSENERDTIIRSYPTSIWSFEGAAYRVPAGG